MPEPIQIKGFGWKPSLPDQRDLRLTFQVALELPPRWSLRASCPAVWDQGDLGSCTAHAVGAAYIMEAKRQGIYEYMPSRLFMYYNARYLEGTTKEDSGATLRDAVKAVANWGVPPESMLSYDINRFSRKPSKRVYQVGLKNQALKYMSVSHSEFQIKNRLRQGFPVIVGFSVYQSFATYEVTRTGNIPMPGPTESLLGGHAVLVVGWDDTRNSWEIRNSWGEGWGDAGYCWMPYQYLSRPDLSGDFWTIQQVES